MSEIKNIDDLIHYLKHNHGIEITDAEQKQQLRNIGYYHGYKGYRFIRTPNKKIAFTNFNQVIAINHFDLELKSIFYRHIMFIETALKNYVLHATLDYANTENFNEIFDKTLTYYKTYTIGTDEYKKALRRRLGLREKFYNTLTRDYTNNRQVVQHFYHKDEHVPIWAIFEVISLGEFGSFVSCLHMDVKKNISRTLHLNQSCDSIGKLTETMIYIIKDLRNSIAHNDVIFDTRFRSSKPNQSLLRCLELDTKIRNITFTSIIDYMILVVYLLKNFRTTQSELLSIITNFENVLNSFREKIPTNIYTQIIHTDTKNKIETLKIYVCSSF